ncbi:NAD-dependent epimerase/dehydratase family protein [uncultured Eudoraea sp.]|uniref:NAD-dependent epimerase/dehydratase family protein n=1 Tax=uncultured Eudoraea sp. TaxID=1035614 RepID=UPI0026253FCB|nr:NAD-dependent epimerase/dehydratase family protein [uncultured Eudoraea sp.]
MAQKTAIILGATGLCGSILLQILLKDNRYKKIKLFSRKSVEIRDEKLQEHIIDLLRLSDHESDFLADEVFCCIGTTRAKTPDKDLYKKIDFGIPLNAASLCKKNKIGTFVVISSLGANAESRVFYTKLKGQMENALVSMGIPKIHILQPSLIAGHREENRPGEWFAKKVFLVLNTVLVGPFRKYRSVTPQAIARSMVWLANNSYEKIKIPSDKIANLGEAEI